jgi:hypothetical protein
MASRFLQPSERIDRDEQGVSFEEVKRAACR